MSHKNDNKNSNEQTNFQTSSHIDCAQNEQEIKDYFQRRQEQLKVVKTTRTPRGQLIDWIPIESQVPQGKISSPPPNNTNLNCCEAHHNNYPELLAMAELEIEGVERGPEGTVPILRKNLQNLKFNKSLKEYLSKSRGRKNFLHRKGDFPSPEEDGNHRYAFSGQDINCIGGEGQFSCFDPYVESSDDFSLIQIALSNSDLGILQTVEAGWQEFQDLTGDWVPHLFTYYTAVGYVADLDNWGGYNTDVKGWVQYDNTIFPGTTFTPYSTVGGEQSKLKIKYQLYQGNWWLSCQDRWIGYYPSKLFMGNRSVFSTLGDHADHISFYGEVFDSDDIEGRTSTDMGSGHFPKDGWKWSAYMHNLLVQKTSGLVNYDGSDYLYSSDPDMYDIEPHFNSGTEWGSFLFLGGPGAG